MYWCSYKSRMLFARMKAGTQRYLPTPRAKRENFWAGHYGVDLCLEPTGNGQKGGVSISQVLVLRQFEYWWSYNSRMLLTTYGKNEI